MAQHDVPTALSCAKSYAGRWRHSRVCDDNEVHNLRAIMNEVFGEENCLGKIVWQKVSTDNNPTRIAIEHEYIVCYARATQRPRHLEEPKR